jgi:hypothetical protein
MVLELVPHRARLRPFAASWPVTWRRYWGAVAPNLLFGKRGPFLTGLDVFVLLAIQRQDAWGIELVIAALMLIIAGCLSAQLFWVQPDLVDVARGLEPRIRSTASALSVAPLLNSAIRRAAIRGPREWRERGAGDAPAPARAARDIVERRRDGRRYCDAAGMGIATIRQTSCLQEHHVWSPRRGGP